MRLIEFYTNIFAQPDIAFRLTFSCIFDTEWEDELIESRHKNAVSRIEELGQDQTVLVTGGASVSPDEQVTEINPQNTYSPPKTRRSPNK